MLLKPMKLLVIFNDQLFAENKESCDSNQINKLIWIPTNDFQKAIKKHPG